MTKKNFKIILFVTVVVLLNALIFFWGRGKRSQETKLYHGETVRDISVTDIHGDPVGISGQGEEWKLIYLSRFITTEDNRNARFMEMLKQKFPGSRLKVVGVFNRQKDELIDFITGNGISFSVARYEDNGSLRKLLPFPGESSIVMLLDPANKIKFVSPFFSQNDMRLLVEKYVSGNVSYAPMEKSPSMKVGGRFPVMTVRNLKSGEIENIPDNNTQLFVIFSGRCTDCLLSKFRTTYPSLENFLIGLGIRTSIIFSYKFIEEDILSIFQESVFDLFLAVDNIPLVEDYFKSIYHVDYEIVALEIDRGGLITYFDSLENFIESQKEPLTHKGEL